MRSKALFVVLGCAILSGCGPDTSGVSIDSTQAALHGSGDPIGLSLFFSNGHMAPLELTSNAPRFAQELDIVEASIPSTTDSGIRPLIDGGTTAALDWRGATQVEELWVPAFDGTFTRERYFRNAKWMEVPSTFTIVPVDAGGHSVGATLVAHAGSDDRMKNSDDDFTRRFAARQVANGCPGVGNCTGATFRAEALIQLRDALDPEKDARTIPASATALQVSFSQLPQHVYRVEVDHRAPGSGSPGHGFAVELAPSSTPANGSFYVPGEQVSFRITFRDGQGQRLFPPGQLPTYAAFLSGQVDSGLRYLDVSLATRLYYSLKHRESGVLAVLSGPMHKLKAPQTVVDPNLLFLPQAPFATPAVDGYTAVAQSVPAAGIVFGGLSDPSIWSAPVSDVVTFTVPADAEPGTYLAAIKARRDFGGEALNRGATVEIQVGQPNATAFTPTTQCTSCHKERTGFGTILHGISDRRACFGCHSSLGIEFDNALDIRVHTIHDRSNRFGANVRQCSNCHSTAPTGPARGLLP